MTDPADIPVASPGYLLDPTAIKALAHPLRLQLLDALAVRGRGTASQLAGDLAETTGATSYHLRQLARHGFIEELAGMGTTRERWWRPVTGGWTMPRDLRREPGTTGLTAALVESNLLETAHRRVLAFLRSLTRWPLAWQRAATWQQAHVELAPDQVQAFTLEVEALIDRYRAAPPGGGARRVRIEVGVYPVGEPPGDDAEPDGTGEVRDG